MASVLKEILDSFYAELEESDALDGKAIEALRNLFDFHTPGFKPSPSGE